MLLGNPWLECRGHLLFSLHQPSIAFFSEKPFPHCTLGGAVSHGSKPPLSKDDIPSQPGQLEVLPLGGKIVGDKKAKPTGS